MASSRKAPSAELVERLEAQVAAEIAAHVAPGTTLTVGLSGGVDSIALLALLRHSAPSLGFELRALHVNHGLSPHAGDWE
jgi:tRNA(Ile)-lysidine synthase